MYEAFGLQTDAETKKPLFNTAAWAKAQNVLEEIRKGYASDPPGSVFYHQRLDDNETSA